ncbi:MAG: PspC domain-containing protein [Bacteroidota bacterium]
METKQNIPPTKRLYKSRRNRKIDGVCGGIAEYFDLDPTIVRVIWVMFTLLYGTGFFLYIAAMIIMSPNPDHLVPSTYPEPPRQRAESRRFWGIILILIGALILMTNLGWFAAFDWWHLSWRFVFPVMLITIGAWFIYYQTRKPVVIPGQPIEGTVPPIEGGVAPKELCRSIADRKLFGVCGGIAKYFSIDPTLVRIAYVLLVIGSVGWALLLYIILAFLLPEEKLTIV